MTILTPPVSATVEVELLLQNLGVSVAYMVSAILWNACGNIKLARCISLF